MSPMWVYQSSNYRERWHYLVYRDNEMGVQMQVATRWTKGRLGHRQVTTFYLDGEDRVFRSQRKLMRAVEARNATPVRPRTSDSRSPLKKMVVSFAHSLHLF